MGSEMCIRDRLGTDPGNADSDGDGVNDLDEQVNGTNPLDAGSY